MSTIFLLHSALGLRPAVTDFAAALEQLGHTVLTPDYYDGHVFDTTTDGIAYRDRVGARKLLGRLSNEVEALPPDAAFAGFSLGAAFAQHFASTRPQSQGAFLLHSAGPPPGPWPQVPVQVHRYAVDDWIEDGEVAALQDAVTASGASFEDFVTAGSGHLFTDLALPDGDAEATALAVERIDARLRQRS